MQILADRIRKLRTDLGITQVRMAQDFGVRQSTLTRYELNANVPNPEMCVRIADYFDVSLDYLFGRTDQPQGRLYDYAPEEMKRKFESEEEARQFVEFCFEPGSAGNERLKQVLAEMLAGDAKPAEKAVRSRK
jgi:transcriptional regulator with XRE-family HTH domain